MVGSNKGISEGILKGVELRALDSPVAGAAVAALVFGEGVEEMLVSDTSDVCLEPDVSEESRP